MKWDLTPKSKFAFHVNKPKAGMLAQLFAAGCKKLAHDCVVTKSMTPLRDRIGVFYGVVPQTQAPFRFYAAENRAIVLDNGWLSSPTNPTFRFSWNSIQPWLQDMPAAPDWKPSDKDLPWIDRDPHAGLALLVLQSKQYFEFMRLGYTRDQWERVTTKILTSKGYTVKPREKPSKRVPVKETFFQQIARAEIVVSLNSAATVKALRYGIPAFCTLDCTPSPLAPVRIPHVGKSAPPNQKAVRRMCSQMASYEITKDDLASGVAIEKMLEVPPDYRRGYVYGN